MQQLVVGVKFKDAGKSYSFSPNNLQLSVGTEVIVETAQGLSFGIVASVPALVEEDKLILPLKNVMRLATESDKAQHQRNLKNEAEALKSTQALVEQLKLDMKLVSAEYNFEGTKVLISFLSDNRVDFRELVKELAQKLHARIELRQIGIRDQARQLGGIGMCGRACCCSTFLNDFEKVSIKMAKNQNLSLNPTKISGLCGRLLCCLEYENNYYVEVGKITPPVNAQVHTPEGVGTVLYTNPLKQIASVRLTDKEGLNTIKDFKFSQIKFERHQNPKNNQGDK